LWHSAWKRRGRKPRRNILINYVRDPLDDPIHGRVIREWVNDVRANSGHPFVHSKQMMRKGNSAHDKMAARLDELGVENVRER